MAEEQVADVSQGEVAPSVLIDDTDTTSPATDWKDQLPDDLKGHQALENISDVGVLAKTMIHAQSMVGAEKIAVPGKWATDDDWDQVWNKLGRPEDATGYELDLGEGAEPDAEFIDSFRQAAHGAGLREVSSDLGKSGPHVRYGPVLVVGQDLQKDRGAAGSIALVDHFLHLIGAGVRP